MKFLIADDHELFLKGLELILSGRYPDAEYVTAHNYNDIFTQISRQDDFDIILTDLAMPGDVWSNALKKIHDRLPETPIIVLSAVFERDVVRKKIDIGVSGYLSKTSSQAEILEALDLVQSGGVYLPRDLLQTQKIDDTERFFSGLSQPVAETDKHLTPRQRDVLECIAAG